jgi:hypothetical protein
VNQKSKTTKGLTSDEDLKLSLLLAVSSTGKLKKKYTNCLQGNFL